jgi:hypothetical protein
LAEHGSPPNETQFLFKRHYSIDVLHLLGSVFTQPQFSLGKPAMILKTTSFNYLEKEIALKIRKNHDIGVKWE